MNHIKTHTLKPNTFISHLATSCVSVIHKRFASS